MSPISQLDAAIADLSGVFVHCERDHFDITVDIPSLQLLFVIENKIDALEGKGQLPDYKKKAQLRYPNLRFLGCLLTPDGYQGEDDSWGAISYATIAKELKRLIEESAPSTEVLIFIQHYIRLIEMKIVTSQELVNACREIYRQHKTAIDLIVEHGQESVLGQAYELFATEKQGQIELKQAALRSSTVYFLFESWLNISGFPQADRKRHQWTSPFPVVLWFEIAGKKLNLRVEVGPLPSEINRAEFLNRFPDKWVDAGSSRVGVKGIYSRIKKATESISEEPSAEDLFEAMKKLWAKSSSWNVETTVRTVVEGFRRVASAPEIPLPELAQP